MTLYTPHRLRDILDDITRTLFGDSSSSATRYELGSGDADTLRGRGTLYHGPDPVVNARRFLATAEDPLYAVGDVTVGSLLEAGASPDLVVTDGRTRRARYEEALDPDGYTDYAAENPAGSITDDAYDAVKAAMDDAPAHLQVAGEEDLLALAVLDHAEEGTLVYGDPGIDGPDGLRAVPVADAQDAVDELLGGC